VKKFIISMIIGSVVGTGMGLAFLFVMPKLPSIFAHSFFYKQMQTVSIFKFASNLYKFTPPSDQFIVKTADTIPQEGKVLYANLATMIIYLYEDGERVAEYKIKSIGREGTAWQTPLGTFKMNYKKENHFSSIGSVWMPYSMHFFGNYFIHGWPYYSNNTPVAEGYSGGCIRLDTSDAQAIYDFVNKDTQLIVTHVPDIRVPEEIQNKLQYMRTSELNDIEGNYIVADISTGEVLTMNTTSDSIPAYSFTKLMTALISLETLNQYQEAIWDQNIVSIADVLYPLLLEDNKEAADLLARHKNQTQFIQDMNTRAQSLGMNFTSFKEPIGDTQSNQTSLTDLLRLFLYIHEYKPFLIKVLGLETYKHRAFTVSPLYTREPAISAGFLNSEKTQYVGLVTVPIRHQNQALESQNKTFLILVSDQEDAENVFQKISTWVGESIVLRK
jgi:hypothetical protein